MSELKEKVLAQINIVDFIGQSVTLVKSGSGFVGCCPFHKEKTGSLHVNPQTQKFKCFGCNVGGDSIDFISMREHLDFPEAVEKLARQLGIPIPEYKRPDGDPHKDLVGVLDKAVGFYNWLLNQEEIGKSAREYILSRGLTMEQANAMGFGVAARPFHKKLKPFQLKLAETAGIVKSKDGKTWDCMNTRLIIPVRNVRGETIALTGRLLQGEGPKYLNTCESPVFKKGETFFGLNPPAIREKGIAIVVEGQFDEISMVIAGAVNTIGTCGTALTAGHVAIVKKYTDKVLFIYDGDTAGKKAARRAIELAIEGGITPYISVLEAGEDPDSVVRNKGLAYIKKLKRQDGFDYILEGLLKTHHGIASRAQVITDEIIPILHKYSNPVTRDLRIVEVAKKLGIEEKAIREKLALPDPNATRVEVLERALLYAIKTSPGLQAVMKRREMLDDLFQGDALKEVEKLLGKTAEQNQ